MEEQKKKCECCTCANFSGYYIKAYCSFLREKTGFCEKHDKKVDKHGTCGHWRKKLYDQRRKRKAIMTALEKVLTDINMIRQFIDEE